MKTKHRCETCLFARHFDPFLTRYGFSDIDVGDACGMRRETIWKLRNGVHCTNTENMRRIGFGLTQFWLSQNRDHAYEFACEVEDWVREMVDIIEGK